MATDTGSDGSAWAAKADQSDTSQQALQVVLQARRTTVRPADAGRGRGRININQHQGPLLRCIAMQCNTGGSIRKLFGQGLFDDLAPAEVVNDLVLNEGLGALR